jgi:hypothetical protein
VPLSVIEALYSALFCVFMAHVRYCLEKRAFIYDCYVKTNSGENFVVGLCFVIGLSIMCLLEFLILS